MNKQQLLAKCADLGIDTEGLDTNAKLKAAIAAKEAELAAAEKVEADKAAAEKAEADKAEAEKAAAAQAEADKAAAEKAKAEKAAAKKAPAVYKDERGRKWTFKKTAPQKINIDGHPMTQAEIFANEDVIADLVYGNSSLLTQTF